MSRTWFITGIGSGLGEAMAAAALECGDIVYGLVRRDDAAQAFEAQAPGRARSFVADVTDRAALASAIDRAIDETGGIDILVNNAGRVLMAYVEEAAVDRVRDLFEVNVLGPLHAVQAVLPSMRARGRGHILNISSGGGIQGVPGVGLYSATKFALEGMSEALAGEVGGLGIKVTIIEPGAFRTSLLEKRTTVETAVPAYARTDGGKFRAHIEGLGGTEHGDPAKLAAAVLKLVELPEPPLRLPLNDDAIAMARNKAKSILEEVDKFEHIGTGLSFDDGSPPAS